MVLCVSLSPSCCCYRCVLHLASTLHVVHVVARGLDPFAASASHLDSLGTMCGRSKFDMAWKKSMTKSTKGGLKF